MKLFSKRRFRSPRSFENEWTKADRDEKVKLWATVFLLALAVFGGALLIVAGFR